MTELTDSTAHRRESSVLAISSLGLLRQPRGAVRQCPLRHPRPKRRIQRRHLGHVADSGVL